MSASERWNAINELFNSIVDLEPQERARALAAFEGDESIRDEVQSLVDALDRDRVRLEPSSGATHLTLMGESAVIPMTLTGRRLGPWAVVREIGRGGMGAVYEAFRADDQYQKRVAVKTLSRGIDSDIVARRFQQERQILASLEHPGIATLIDGGVTQEGVPYFVMEFVDGEPIDRYCASQKLSVRDRLDLFRQVCAAVQYAHRRLVVHRDLKPSNVLVSANGDVKLVDFGIAKILASDTDHGFTVTEAGGTAFTTGYASPEQVRGEPISTATDVYSLGVTLFRLLTGRLPFEAGNLSTTELLRSITEDASPLPSKVCTDAAAAEMRLANRNSLANELSGEVDDIVLAALRKEPERRYSTVAAMSDDIKRYLQGQQVSARPDTWRYRVQSFTRRNPRFVGAMIVAAFSLVIGTGVASWQANRAGVERDRARAEVTRSARVVAFIEQLLAAPVQGTLTESTVKALDEAVERARAELSDDPLARAAVFRTAAKAYAYHNRSERARPLIDSALMLDRKYANARSAEVGRDLTVAARIAYSAGLLDSAVAQSREAVALLREFPSDRPDDLPTALLHLSFALTYTGKPAEAYPLAEEARTLESPRSPTALLGYVYMALGESKIFQGDARGSYNEYSHAIAVFDSLPGAQPVERGIAELGLGTLSLDLGVVAEADRHARRALQIFEERWGPGHAYTGRAHGLLARVAVRKNDTATTRTELAAARRALEHSQLGLVDWVTLKKDMALVMFASNHRPEAIVLLRDALAERREELVRSPQIMAFAEQLLGTWLMEMRRTAEAREVLDSAFNRQSNTYGPQNPVTMFTAKQLLFLAEAARDTRESARYATLFSRDSAEAIRARARTWAR